MLVEGEDTLVGMEYASTYFAGLYRLKQWNALCLEDKISGLIGASNLIAGGFCWRGEIYDRRQVWPFPRSDFIGTDGRQYTWKFQQSHVDDIGTPIPVKNAISELALTNSGGALWSVNTSGGTKAVGQVVKKRTVGPLSREFFNANELTGDGGGTEASKYPMIEAMLNGLHTGSTLDGFQSSDGFIREYVL